MIDLSILAFLLFSVLSITVAQAAVLLALVAWGLKLLLSKGTLSLRLPLLPAMAGFFLASALATLTAVDPYVSLRELRNVFQPALFYLTVNHLATEEEATTPTLVLMVMGTLIALYGLSQAVARGPTFRIHGTMSIYMTFAGILMLIDTLAMAHLVFDAQRRTVLWLVPVLLTLTAALVMTHTRSAWLGLAGGFSFIFGLRKRLLLLALPAVGLVIFLVAPQAVQGRIQSLLDPQDVTAKERLYMWGSGIQIIRDHPWTGVGMDGIKRVYLAYQDPKASGKRRGHLHNNLIQVAAERGLIGLAFWLWIWGAYYRYAWQIYGRLGQGEGRAKALVVGSMASVMAFHIAGLFEYTFGDSEVVMLVYFLMALPFLTKGYGAAEAVTPDARGKTPMIGEQPCSAALKDGADVGQA